MEAAHVQHVYIYLFLFHLFCFHFCFVFRLSGAVSRVTGARNPCFTLSNGTYNNKFSNVARQVQVVGRGLCYSPPPPPFPPPPPLSPFASSNSLAPSVTIPR